MDGVCVGRFEFTSCQFPGKYCLLYDVDLDFPDRPHEYLHPLFLRAYILIPASKGNFPSNLLFRLLVLF